ncbi:MAG: glycine-rich domain-containing protein, partial [Candidatus Micrarchaeia archaeon]
GASNYAGSSATYYGSGGGGGGGNFGAGGNGYQGIVIIRYPTEADIGILSPTVGQALPYGTQNVYLNLTTNNANAACKFDKQVAFDFSTAGTLMAGAGTKNHSGIVGGLLSGQNNLVYIECNLTTGKLASYSLTLYVNGPATGGTISSITVNGTNYTLHTFTSGGTFTASTSMNVEALIVAGGGGAGSTHGGGGGGGGLIYNSSIPVSAQGYSIVVGSGGSGGASGAANNGNSGTGSSFAGLSAIGGGAGHAGYTNPGAGSNGGSGGGGGASTSTASTYSGGTGTSGQGRNGGASYGGGGGTARGGGGGGAGAVGTSAGASQVGNGGAGIQNSITGTNVYYAGGGGGGSDNGGTSTGGSGGGGAGAALDAGSNATSYGSGGGAGGGNFGAGGNGYQGIVIIRYPSSSYSMLAAPNASTYGGESTNLSAVFDIRNVTNLTLEKPGAGRIKFPPTHSVNAVGQDYDTHVVIGNGFVSVNTSALDSSFNSTAALIMNLTGIYSGTGAPTIYYYEAFTSDLNAILANGAVCSAPRCTGISWNSTTKLLTFNVSGFSDYGVNGSSGFGGAGGGSTNSTGTLGINITSTNQIAVYTSSSSNNSAFSFIPVTPPAAGSMTLLSNQSSNVTGGDTGFLVENQGNVNVSITVASDKDAANFIGGSSPLFQMFGGANESGACPSLNTSMQDLSGSEITVCPSLAYSDSQDTIWAYVLVKIDSDSPPQTSTATLTFTSTQV